MLEEFGWPDLGWEITLETFSDKLTRLDHCDINTYTGCLTLFYTDGTSEEFYDSAIFAFYDYLSWHHEANPLAPDEVTFEVFQLWKADQERQGNHFFAPPVLAGSGDVDGFS